MLFKRFLTDWLSARSMYTCAFTCFFAGRVYSPLCAKGRNKLLSFFKFRLTNINLILFFLSFLFFLLCVWMCVASSQHSVWWRSILLSGQVQVEAPLFTSRGRRRGAAQTYSSSWFLDEWRSLEICYLYLGKNPCHVLTPIAQRLCVYPNMCRIRGLNYCERYVPPGRSCRVCFVDWSIPWLYSPTP